MKHPNRNAGSSLGAMGPRLSLLLCVLAFPLGAQQPRDEYVVTFTERAPLMIAVEARVTSIDGTLHVEPYTSQDEGFWRSHVTGLAVFDSAGGRLGVDSATPTSWRLRGAARGRVTLRYVVDVSFASRPFPSGNQKGGYTDGKALYLTTRPLFVTPDTGDGAMARDVQFVVPGGWRVETPWEKTGVARYRAMSRRDLAYNTIVVGRFATSDVRLGKLRMVAAFLGPVARDSAVIGDAFVRAAREYFRIFPDTPAGNYLMTVFYADHDDGEAFAASAAITFGNRIGGGDGILFNNKIAHELLHYWIGQRIRAADHDRMSWLSEGFTEYVANRTIYRTGLITRQEYLAKLSRHVGAYGYFWYSPLYEGRTLLDAGLDKTRNRFGVYDGGAVAALVLDLTIADLTKGKRSLDDVLRLMWNRYAASGRRYELEDVSAALVEVGGESLRDFVPRYVSRHDLLPYRETLSPCIRVLAWPLSGEAYLEETAAAGSGSRAACKVLLSRQ